MMKPSGRGSGSGEMDKLVDVKGYDPERSEKLADWSPGDYGGLRHEAETLYRSEDGGYFLLYEGGLFSRFHELAGVEHWYGGTHIRPVIREEAIAWCEETGNYEAIEKHFKGSWMPAWIEGPV